MKRVPIVVLTLSVLCGLCSCVTADLVNLISPADKATVIFSNMTSKYYVMFALDGRAASAGPIAPGETCMNTRVSPGDHTLTASAYYANPNNYTGLPPLSKSVNVKAGLATRWTIMDSDF